MQDAVTETDHLGAPGTTHMSSHRRQRALELPPVEDDETRQLQEAMVLSLQEERRQEEERKRMRDAVLVERPRRHSTKLQRSLGYAEPHSNNRHCRRIAASRADSPA